MKKYLLPAALALLLLLQAVSLFRIFRLQAALSSVQSQLSSDIVSLSDSLHSELSSSLYGMEQMLTKQASALSSADIVLGEPDIMSRTVPLTVHILPKSQTPDTAATLIVDAQRSPMTRTDAGFSVTLPLGLFQSPQKMAVSLITDGVSTQEDLSERLPALPEAVLPRLSVWQEDGSSTQRDNALQLNQGFSIALDQSSSLRFVDLRVQHTRNGTQAKEEILASKTDDMTASVTYQYTLKETLKLQPNDRYTVTAIATDSWGLLHKCVFYDIMLDAAGESQGDSFAQTPEAIFAADGTLLYQAEAFG